MKRFHVERSMHFLPVPQRVAIIPGAREELAPAAYEKAYRFSRASVPSRHYVSLLARKCYVARRSFSPEHTEAMNKISLPIATAATNRKGFL